MPQQGAAPLAPLTRLSLHTHKNSIPAFGVCTIFAGFHFIREVIPIAIYHCNISIVSRGKGKSAVAAAAYRSGEKLTNEWDGMTHDYTRKGGVVHTEIMLPPHAPPSFSDRSTLWNSVELYEKAGNAQLAREIDAALPIELSREEQIRLVREYCSSQFVSRGMCVDFAIHDTDSGNPHCHIMLTMRPLNERGAWAAKSKKEYDLDENGERICLPSGRYKTHKVADFSNTPAFEQCVKLQSGAHQYLLLTGEYDWKEAKRLGFRSYDLPRKDMWHQIRGYVVKNEYAESLICALSGVDFMGRWMPEAQSNSAMYNKEYYWSDAHTFFNNPYYCGLEWVNIDSDHLNCVFPEKVLIPVKQYYSERKGELNSLNSEIASIYWHKPCEEMYTKLQLKYLKGSNSAFVDGAGELVCFESSELIGNDTGFYIRYDKLLEFLKSSSYTLVWTSLCEKRILTPSFGKWDLPPKAIHMSSVYYLKDGKIAKASETLFEDRLYY